MCSTIARSGTASDEIAEMSETSADHYQELHGFSNVFLLGSSQEKSGLVAPHRATHDRRDVCWVVGPALLRADGITTRRDQEVLCTHWYGSAVYVFSRDVACLRTQIPAGLFAVDSLAKGAMSSDTCNVAWKQEASSATMDEAGQASTMTGNVERDAWAALTGHGAWPLGRTGESTLGLQRSSMIQSIGRQIVLNGPCICIATERAACSSMLAANPDCLLLHHGRTSIHPSEKLEWQYRLQHNRLGCWMRISRAGGDLSSAYSERREASRGSVAESESRSRQEAQPNAVP